MKSSDSSATRLRLLVDKGVQGSLLRRGVLYSFACSVYFLVILVVSEAMSNPAEPFLESLVRCLDEAIFWAPGLVLLAPVFAYDLLKLTNRFAGPMFRLRREMRRLANGESVDPISFREDDFWDDAAEVFNQLREELLDLRKLAADFDQTNQRVSEVASEQQLFVPGSEDQNPMEDLAASLQR